MLFKGNDGDSGEGISETESIVKPKVTELVRVPKPVLYNAGEGTAVDQRVVNFRFYNSFNYSILQSPAPQEVRLTVGITSANPGEGKTLVATNLAVSLTLGYRKRTVLVDLNINNPRVHEIFGTPDSPGLVDSLRTGPVHVNRTQIENLSVLPVGRVRADGRRNGAARSFIGLENMSAFGDVIESLEREFEFVIVDMPPINAGDFPILFSNQLDGLIVVVDLDRTRRDDLDKLFQKVNERQVLGFVCNHTRTK